MGRHLTSITATSSAHHASHTSPAVAASGPRLDDAGVELQVATMEGQGRVRLAQIARRMGWSARSTLVLAVQDGIIRVVDVEAFPHVQGRGIGIALDSRLRLQLPFGIRTSLGLQPGTRLILLGAPSEGTLAGIPVSHFVERLTAGL
jgi:hypothetical protein